MELMAFQFSGIIKEVNKKRVRQGQIIKEPCCYVDWPPPYPARTIYWEIILEEDKSSKKIKLVFFGEEISDFEKKFVVGERYLFYCTGGSGYYWPHNWKKINQ